MFELEIVFGVRITKIIKIIEMHFLALNNWLIMHPVSAGHPVAVSPASVMVHCLVKVGIGRIDTIMVFILFNIAIKWRTSSERMIPMQSPIRPRDLRHLRIIMLVPLIKNMINVADNIIIIKPFLEPSLILRASPPLLSLIMSQPAVVIDVIKHVLAGPVDLVDVHYVEALVLVVVVVVAGLDVANQRAGVVHELIRFPGHVNRLFEGFLQIRVLIF